MYSPNWQTQLMLDWMTSSESSALYWAALASKGDSAADAMAWAVVQDIEVLPRCWARDVAMRSAQKVDWGFLVSALGR